MLTLEGDVFQRSLSAAGTHCVTEGSIEVRALFSCGSLATAALPPHSALFSQRLLGLTHRWWSEAEGPETAAYICIKLHSTRYPELAPFQLPDPWQLARSHTDLLTALAAALDRRQPHNVPPFALSPSSPRSCCRRISHPGVSELRDGDLHSGRLGESFRGTLLLEGPATSAALSAGDLLTALARPLWCGKRGPVHRQ